MNDPKSTDLLSVPLPSALDEGSEPQDRVAELLREYRPTEVPPERRVFVNRNLRMSAIEYIGFDMDYTLAEYTTAMEVLQVKMTLERMVAERGYPAEALDIPYDPAFAIRGLVIDKKHGNILKADAHRHITRALHGFVELSKDERRALYRQERVRMKTDRYALVDTIFAVPETWLFAMLVTLEDKLGGKRTSADRYVTIFDDIRTTIDRIHADDSLKTLITADIGTYISRDPRLASTLVRLRSAGKKLFLMTNSLGPYTTAVMSYLLDGARADHPDWKQYFDVICVGSRKPSFFESNEPFRRLDEHMKPLPAKVRSFEAGAIYHGGNRAEFEQLLGGGGDSILYIGDNMYGDIMRSKTLSTWRTALIVPELEPELRLMETLRPVFDRREELDKLRRQLDAEIHQQAHLISALGALARRTEPDSVDRPSIDRALTIAKRRKGSLEKSLQLALHEIHDLNVKVTAPFNPHFGRTFKTGDEHSLFGEQVEDYACLYTSRVSNFGSVSPFQYFRAPRDLLPHEVAPVPHRNPARE